MSPAINPPSKSTVAEVVVACAGVDPATSSAARSAMTATNGIVSKVWRGCPIRGPARRANELAIETPPQNCAATHSGFSAAAVSTIIRPSPLRRNGRNVVELCG